ncbi:NAD(P)H-dependent oxidoreductase [Ruegeria pomeroyi]|uniref:NAD(P)H-dependent oxidoreductase n=1 Tax=Ruegeria alba TaxID=2916756 RepID=A0ABS9NXV8_9RHOB|nr:NADPH-dependent FMN reductase [Ruegeria alba]MCE8520880.1 NAD(P)H-dependent oxidoreductase [Ruegeria pomeroyi]MCE8532723.1 NAD(P)H-dependent oxidoreductase [Ruegeria pomeroyi]MCG6559068.1 NAD(P)H-dependent oxidoreductase [Ruegeria alba]
MTDLTLLGLSGALRAASTNRKLLREAARLFGPASYTEADLNLPLYDGDNEAADGIPEVVQRLADQIAAADAVIISTPEYNKGPSGALKNALDWVSRTSGKPWADKPVAVMSAAGGRAGGERAQAVLRGFIVPFQPRLVTGPEVHLADSSNQFDENGQLTSALYVQTLQTLMDKLRTEAQR